MTIAGLIYRLVDIFIPGTCSSCGAEKANYPMPACPACLEKALAGKRAEKTRISGLGAVWSCCAYTGGVMACLKDLKYRGNRSVLPFLEAMVKTFIKEHPYALEGIQIILPVPAYPSRLRQRGYNQADIIARMVSDITNIPYSGNILLKVRDTEAQAGLRLHKRLNNLNGVFSAPAADRVSGKKVLIVDDIVTSGSTIKACARSLEKASPAGVSGFTVAKTL